MNILLGILAASVGSALPVHAQEEPPAAENRAESAGSTEAAAAQSEKTRARIGRWPTRLDELKKRLDALDSRLTRAGRAVPTPEEFRRQIGDGRQGIEKLRSAVNERWKGAQAVAESRAVKLDQRSVKTVLPEALSEDGDFLRAQKHATEAARQLSELEERFIRVMLTPPLASEADAAMPDAPALEREWTNLAANQKRLSTAVQNARRAALAAGLPFEAADLLDPSAVRVPKSDRAASQTREQAGVALGAREASAELVAALEFRETIGAPPAKR